MPLAFTNLGAGGAITFSNAGGHKDTLDLNGTLQNQDVFSVNGTKDTVQIENPTGAFRTVPINTPGILVLNLHGLGGGDTFNIAGTLPYFSVLVDPGDPATVNLTAASAAVNIDLGNATTDSVVAAGYGAPVTLHGVDVLNANVGANASEVDSTTTQASLSVTPTGPTPRPSCRRGRARPSTSPTPAYRQ